METYITIHKIDRQQEFAVCLRKQKGALQQSRGERWGRKLEGGSKVRGYIYTYVHHTGTAGLGSYNTESLMRLGNYNSESLIC